jgi:sarcosine oxidase subunit delta
VGAKRKKASRAGLPLFFHLFVAFRVFLAIPLLAWLFSWGSPVKIIHCPVNGPRPAQEFVYGGEVRDMPDAAAVTDEQWADYVFNRQGEPGLKREWWYHLPSGTWFVAERDNRTDQFLRTYLFDAVPDV